MVRGPTLGPAALQLPRSSRRQEAASLQMCILVQSAGAILVSLRSSLSGVLVFYSRQHNTTPVFLWLAAIHLDLGVKIISQVIKIISCNKNEH